MPNFTKKEHFLPPDTQTYVCVTGGKKCSFIKKFDVLCFLKTCFEIRPFALLPTICFKRIFLQAHTTALYESNSVIKSKSALSEKMTQLQSGNKKG